MVGSRLDSAYCSENRPGAYRGESFKSCREMWSGLKSPRQAVDAPGSARRAPIDGSGSGWAFPVARRPSPAVRPPSPRTSQPSTPRRPPSRPGRGPGRVCRRDPSARAPLEGVRRRQRCREGVAGQHRGPDAHAHQAAIHGLCRQSMKDVRLTDRDPLESFAPIASIGDIRKTRRASPRTAQMLARHTDIRLAMRILTDPRLLDGRSAVEALPTLTVEKAIAIAQATGTHGENSVVLPVVIEPRVTMQNGVNKCTSAEIATSRQPITGERLGASLCDDALVAQNGGGGNRTRVPEHFRIGLYVRSRSFVVIPRTADRQAVRGTSSTKFSSRCGRAARCDQPAAYRRPA